MKLLRILAALLTACLLAGCTLIHIEGDSNTVRDIEGHNMTLLPPATSQTPVIP